MLLERRFDKANILLIHPKKKNNNVDRPRYYTLNCYSRRSRANINPTLLKVTGFIRRVPFITHRIKTLPLKKQTLQLFAITDSQWQCNIVTAITIILRHGHPFNKMCSHHAHNYCLLPGCSFVLKNQYIHPCVDLHTHACVSLRPTRLYLLMRPRLGPPPASYSSSGSHSPARRHSLTPERKRERIIR